MSEICKNCKHFARYNISPPPPFVPKEYKLFGFTIWTEEQNWKDVLIDSQKRYKSERGSCFKMPETIEKSMYSTCSFFEVKV